jgi:hypothetical protein
VARVVVLPGVMGSAIGIDRWVVTTGYWLHPAQLVVNGPFPLAVNPAGTGDAPNPTFKGTVIQGVLRSYYGRLVDHFTALGHQVLPLPYDWRLGVQLLAPRLWASVRA